MKFLIRSFFIIILIVCIGAGCSPSNGSLHTSSIKVGATIFPLYDLVRTVGGEDVDAVLMLPPGTSPHTYEPTPSLIQNLQGALAIFTIGHGIDSWISSVQNALPQAKIITTDRNITLRAPTQLLLQEEEEDEGNIDPHYWLDPDNGIIMVRTIVDELSALDPAHSANFSARGDRLIDEITRHDIEWKEKLSYVTNKDLVTFHDAYMYFAAHFGLNIVATFEPFPGQEPTPKYIKGLSDAVERHGITTLYLEPELPASALESFARDYNLDIAILDPESGITDADSYIKLIDYNVDTIAAFQK